MPKQSLRSASGQSLLEFAIVMPLICVLALGVVEVGYALLDAHIVTRLAREGSNLISRDTTLQDATGAMRGMNTRPVNFDSGSKVIFSVVRNVDTSGAPNYNKAILYQRVEYGSFPDTSKLTISGSASFGPAPEYQAANADTNTGLQLTNLPPNVGTTLGGMVYITEIYSPHTMITPFNQFGFTMPSSLYSIAYF
jgi:Flp pilus assembly protein TadG